MGLHVVPSGHQRSSQRAQSCPSVQSVKSHAQLTPSKNSEEAAAYTWHSKAIVLVSAHAASQMLTTGVKHADPLQEDSDVREEF